MFSHFEVTQSCSPGAFIVIFSTVAVNAIKSTDSNHLMKLTKAAQLLLSCITMCVCGCPSCTHQDLCQLCYQQFTMDDERGGARRKTADRWVEKSRNRYGEAEVGTTVLLTIPHVDKGRCELPNSSVWSFRKLRAGCTSKP